MRTKYPEKTRQALLDAATRLFIQKGYSVTRLEDIAIEAGLTRGSISFHFKNKLNIFKEIVKQGTASIYDEFSDVLDGQVTAVEGIKLIVSRFLLSERAATLVGLNRILRSELHEKSSEIYDQVFKNVNAFADILAAMLKKGIESGEFKDTIDPFLYSRIIFYAMRGILGEKDTALAEISIRDIVDCKIEMILNGILSNKN